MPSKSLRLLSSSSCSTGTQLQREREAFFRSQQSEKEYEPIRRLIELREAVDQDIRELRSEHPKPNQKMKQRIAQLIELRNQIQEEIHLIGDDLKR